MDAMRTKPMKSQAALDFMSAYGLVFIVIAIVSYVIFHFIFANQALAPVYCNAAPSFSCVAYALNSTGAFTVLLSQATGGTIIMNAAACSTSVNTIGDWPQYGNVNLVRYTANPLFYPTNSNLQTPLTIYSSSQAVFSANCYTASGIAKGPTGSTITGYLWINYTYSNLPSSTNTIQRVIQFSTKFS